MAAVWKAVEGLAEEQARGRHEEETRERPLVDLTSGYFSLYGPYKKAVIKSKADVRIIAAAPKVRTRSNTRGCDQKLIHLAACSRMAFMARRASQA